MKRIKVLLLLVFMFLIVGCGTTNIEIFRFVSHENTIYIGQTINLDLIMGEYSEDAVVRYSFSKEGIIDFEDGVATGLAIGEVEITATVDNIKKAKTKVIVIKVPIDGMQILATKSTIFVDETLQLETKIFPSSFSNDVTWSIETGEDVATISSTGLLTPLRGEKNSTELNAGGAKVRVVATSKEDSKVKVRRDFFVKYRPVENIEITVENDKFEYTFDELETITQIQLTYVLKPANTNPLVTITSTDTSILLVDENGVITFPETLKAGTAEVRVRSLDNKMVAVQFTIRDLEAELIAELQGVLANITISNPKNLEEDFTVPTQYEDYDLVWTLDNEDGTLELVDDEEDTTIKIVKVTPTEYAEDEEGNQTNEKGLGTLKVSVTKNGKTVDKTWELEVIAKPNPNPDPDPEDLE